MTRNISTSETGRTYSAHNTSIKSLHALSAVSNLSLNMPCTKITFSTTNESYTPSFQETYGQGLPFSQPKSSASMKGHTFGRGTSHLPAFSFLFCLMVLLRTLALSAYKHTSQSNLTLYCLWTCMHQPRQ